MQSVIARAKAALQGSETEQRIAVLLYDDTVDLISSFELNQLASLTFHEAQMITSQQDMTDILLDHLEQIVKAPGSYSTITVLKAVTVAHHLLLHGAQKVVPAISQHLGGHIHHLTTSYNTVLMAQQNSNSGAAWFLRLKGGGVDQGGPVRSASQTVVALLSNPSHLQQTRHTVADPHSLVPVGRKKEVAFCTDEVKLKYLQTQLKLQQQQQTRSNLAKADNGFGGGYNAANGGGVVGAAHGIEEMLQQERKEQQKFSDDAAAAAHATAYSSYQAPDLMSLGVVEPVAVAAAGATRTTPTPISSGYDYGMDTPQQDLMGMGMPAPPPAQADLLDFSAVVSEPPTSSSLPPQQDLLFGGANAYTATSPATHDPFAVVSAPPPPTSSDTTPTAMHGLLGAMSLGGASTTTTPPSVSIANTTSMSSSIMSSNTDRFSALDALSDPSATAPADVPSFAVAKSTTTTTTLPTMDALTNLNGLTMNGNSNNLTPQTMTTPTASMSSIQVSSFVGGPNNNDDDDDNGFVMGGGMGTGLEPLGAPPAAPPPPPTW